MQGDDQPRVRVAIVEDDDVLRAALVEMLAGSRQFVVVGEVSTLQEAFALAARGPQVFLIDLALPDGSGLELISKLGSLAPHCKTLVISVFGDVRNVVRAIELGADGYLLKGADVGQVAAAIDMVLRGEAPLSPAVAGHILNKVRQKSRPAPQTQSVQLKAQKKLDAFNKEYDPSKRLAHKGPELEKDIAELDKELDALAALDAAGAAELKGGAMPRSPPRSWRSAGSRQAKPRRSSTRSSSGPRKTSTPRRRTSSTWTRRTSRRRRKSSRG